MSAWFRSMDQKQSYQSYQSKDHFLGTSQMKWIQKYNEWIETFHV